MFYITHSYFLMNLAQATVEAALATAGISGVAPLTAGYFSTDKLVSAQGARALTSGEMTSLATALGGGFQVSATAPSA